MMTVIAINSMPVIWVCGQLADRLGRKPTFVLFQVGAVIMVLLYSRITEPGALLWVEAIMGMFVNGVNGGMGALMSEVYPTVARATAQNVLWNVGRGIGSLGTRRGRDVGRSVLFSSCDWPSRINLLLGYPRYIVFDPRAQGQSPRVAKLLHP